METHGFYIGRRHQEVSGYKVETNYDFSGKRPTAEISVTLDGDKEATTYNKKFNRNASFIDSNQLILYLRSLDKPSGGFPDKPAVLAFNPFTRESTTVSFYLSNNNKVMLNDKQHGESITASLDLVTVAIGGTYFMQQYNVPNLKSKDVDVLHGIYNNPKYTTLRFRVGYLSYELAQYDEAIWNALKPATESTPEAAE